MSCGGHLRHVCRGIKANLPCLSSADVICSVSIARCLKETLVIFH